MGLIYFIKQQRIVRLGISSNPKALQEKLDGGFGLTELLTHFPVGNSNFSDIKKRLNPVRIPGQEDLYIYGPELREVIEEFTPVI